MICKNCGKNNPDDSHFCETCGHKIVETQERKEHEGIERISDEISDVLFTPKRNNTAGKVAWVIVAILVIFIIGLLYWVMVGRYNQGTYDGNSGYENPTPTIDYSQPGSFPVSYLDVTDSNLEWVGQNLYFKGVLKNTFNMPAKDISVRIDFYSDEAATQLFDTRYVTIAGVAGEGAYTFDEQVFAYPTKKFWWRAAISSASFIQ